MATINSKFSRFTAATNVSGVAQLSLKMPGVFNGLLPNIVRDDQKNQSTITNGRLLNELIIFFGNPSNGDFLSALHVEDIDGVVPVPQRALFPDYPILKSVLDLALPAGNRGYFFSKDPLFVDNTSSPFFIPSALYLIIRAQKSPIVSDNLYVNISSIAEN